VLDPVAGDLAGYRQVVVAVVVIEERRPDFERGEDGEAEEEGKKGGKQARAAPRRTASTRKDSAST